MVSVRFFSIKIIYVNETNLVSVLPILMMPPYSERYTYESNYP
jgi:hypothetical protein